MTLFLDYYGNIFLTEDWECLQMYGPEKGLKWDWIFFQYSLWKGSLNAWFLKYHICLIDVSRLFGCHVKSHIFCPSQELRVPPVNLVTTPPTCTAICQPHAPTCTPATSPSTPRPHPWAPRHKPWGRWGAWGEVQHRTPPQAGHIRASVAVWWVGHDGRIVYCAIHLYWRPMGRNIYVDIWNVNIQK